MMAEAAWLPYHTGVGGRVVWPQRADLIFCGREEWIAWRHYMAPNGTVSSTQLPSTSLARLASTSHTAVFCYRPDAPSLSSRPLFRLGLSACSVKNLLEVMREPPTVICLFNHIIGLNFNLFFM
ncbi:unnamed protein product [Protopolystoma xenopodis]|uniref:Uncharacterized protein n=1 Tax=Protopolystoma xenopodis TaxID=117903 RepID=A0A448WF40_9PLAT|nr:unnamed protein product [Protopolystoma xenopodis]